MSVLGGVIACMYVGRHARDTFSSGWHLVLPELKSEWGEM